MHKKSKPERVLDIELNQIFYKLRGTKIASEKYIWPIKSNKHRDKY